MPKKEEKYLVALSFAGEDRKYVEAVAKELAKMQISFFYDKYETVELWGENLYEHLIDVYKNKSHYTVIFCSEHYAKKLWSNHERRAAQARAFETSQNTILPVRIDDTEITGILPTTGYVRASEYSPKQLAELIKQKIGPVRRKNFFPDNPDRLYAVLNAESEEEKEKIHTVLRNFFLKILPA